MPAPVNLTGAVLSATQEGAVIRSGYVRRTSPLSAQVEVGGTILEAGYLNSYNPPIVGDLVAVAKQDSTWLVLGSLAGVVPDHNLLSNGSFDTSLSGWSAVQITGAALPSGASVSWTSDTNSPDQGGVAQFVNASTTNNLHMALVSAPIPAAAGQSFMLSAYAATIAFNPSGTTVVPPHNVQIFASWHLDSTSAFPDPSGLILPKMTMAQQIVDLRETPPYTFLSGAVTVPANADLTHMRVVLAVVAANNPGTNGGVRWDAASVRRLT
jgi:hypothetical protein